MKQTMQTVVLMVVTVVEEMSTPIIVQNGFAMKKNNTRVLKVTFFQKVWFVFQITQSQKKIFQKNYAELGFQVQGSFFGIFFLGD